MPIGAEWVLNKYKQKIYAISHSKAVVRGESTVDADLTSLETSMSQFETNLSNLQNLFNRIDFEGINSHLSAKSNTSDGVHGIRFYNGKLQYYDGSKWVSTSTSDFDNMTKWPGCTRITTKTGNTINEVIVDSATKSVKSAERITVEDGGTITETYIFYQENGQIESKYTVTTSKDTEGKFYEVVEKL